MARRKIGWRLLILAGWLAGILLPMYSITRLSPGARKVFDRVFRTQVAHVGMHLFLYGVLACLVASLCPVRWRRRPLRFAVLVLAAVLVVGVAQEAIQLKAEGVLLGSDELFDVGIDFLGGVIGISLFLFIDRRRSGRYGVATRPLPSPPGRRGRVD